jgi:hypothetical protein
MEGMKKSFFVCPNKRVENIKLMEILESSKHLF